MRVAAAVVAFALTSVGAANAADVAGWYAGIYAGPAIRSDAQFSNVSVDGTFVQRGALPHPDTVANLAASPLPGGAYRTANTILAAMENVSTAIVGLTQQDGSLGFGPAAMLDFAIGYGLGNGGRVELHYAGAHFDAQRYALGEGVDAAGLGSYVAGTGDWVWFRIPGPGTTVIPAESGDVGNVLGYSTYFTRTDFLLLDGWYDLEAHGSITPYLGGGLGVARVSSSMSDEATGLDLGTATRFVPAGELGAGVKIKLAGPVAIDIGYRVRVAAGAELDNAIQVINGTRGLRISYAQSGPILVHGLIAGLTFAFD